MAISIASLLIISWGSFFTVFFSQQDQNDATAFGSGLALTAFLLGVRHAFDADHIAAIDNTSRKLIHDGRDSSSVGMWFAFGHSAVVMGAVCLAVGGVGAIISQIGVNGPHLSVFTRVWGPSVSGVFLLTIAAVNVSALLKIIKGTRRREHPVSTSSPKGFMTRLLDRAGANVDQPWKMIVVGFLFGLGFDTASTITLLLMAGGAGVGMPWHIALLVPLLFAAGMVTCDGLNSMAMTRIYVWTAARPDDRIRYNVLLISISILLALTVGVIQLSGVLADLPGAVWPPIVAISSIELEDFGYVAVGTLFVAWLISWCFTRVQRAAAWRRSLAP